MQATNFQNLLQRNAPSTAVLSKWRYVYAAQVIQYPFALFSKHN